MSAYEVALAIAAEHRPDLVVDGQIDLDRARTQRDAVSSGEQVLLDVMLSLCGEGLVPLHRLDALDVPNRAVVAAAMRHL